MAEKKYELKEVQKLQGHTDKVWCVAWDPVSGTNGNPAILASCSADKTLRIWKRNPQNAVFECLKTIEGVHAGTGRSCSWSPDGSWLAIPSYDGTTYIWDKIDDDFECIHVPEVDKEEVVSVSWDPLGANLATCSRDFLRFWGRVSFTDPEFDCHDVDEFEAEDIGKMVQWHPFKNILFAYGCDDTINVWFKHDSDQWYHAQTLDHTDNGHLSKVCSISFNATGDKMVTSSEDLSIKVWVAERMQSGWDWEYVPWKHLYDILGYHKYTIFSVHWSSEGIIASGAADGAICLFVENQDGLSQGRSNAMHKLLLRKEKAHEANVNSVQWGPKEIQLLASSSDDGTLKIWELNPRQ